MSSLTRAFSRALSRVPKGENDVKLELQNRKGVDNIKKLEIEIYDRVKC